MTHSRLSAILAGFTGLLLAHQSAMAAGVSVGNSALIGALQYSDSFTIGAGATVPARVGYGAQSYPLPAGVDAVERTYGNASASWGTTPFSIATDASNFPTGGAPYPGTSGAGSATGFTQTGGGGDWSIPYNLSNDFLIQFDYVQQTDRVDVSIGTSGSNIFGAGNLSLFIRTTGQSTLPEIGIFNLGVGEFNTGLTSGVGSAHQWNNYALRVNIPAQTLEIFTNQTSRGVINLATLNGGAYAPFLSNNFVGYGGSGDDRQWSDNFQVGTPVPEPGSTLLASLAGLALLRRRRA